jgi:fructose/tagatose bisphosphate aldolase
MKMVNAKNLCDLVGSKSFGVPSLNNINGNYEIALNVIESAQEMKPNPIIGPQQHHRSTTFS